MKKHLRIFALLIAVLTIFTFTACGNNDDDYDDDDNIDYVDEYQSEPIDNSKGYVVEMTSQSGFDLEHTTLDSFLREYETPISKFSRRMRDVDYTYLSYSFGNFCFEDHEGIAVLTSATLNEEFINDIYGIKMGDDLYDTAEKIYPNSKQKIEDELKKDKKKQVQYLMLYGTEKDGIFTAPYGMFTTLNMEQTKAKSMYRLEYGVQSETEGKIQRVFFTFDSDRRLNEIMINLSEVL